MSRQRGEQRKRLTSKTEPYDSMTCDLESLTALLKDAAEAAAVVERERGQDPWLSEVLGDYAERRQMECYGPKGLLEG